MHLSLVGINHHTAPVALREKVSVRTGHLPETLQNMKQSMESGIILSTCNRTELYSLEAQDHGREWRSCTFLQDYFGISQAELNEYTYRFMDREATQHLFRVACGLDSMVIGEYEVLGQVKNSLEAAENAGVASLPLRRIFTDAIRTGRRVRDETAISKNALSISSVAVDLAGRVVGDLASCRMLVIGAGEAGRLVAQAARDRGTRNAKVASRTFERATALAETLGGTPIHYENIVEEIESADLIISCADAPHHILTPFQVSPAMKKRPDAPLVIIDIAVPRNVEPAVGQMENVFLYNIDHLNEISEQNRRAREEEAGKAEEVIAFEVDRFDAWWQTHAVRPAIRALMARGDRIRTTHLQKTLKKLPPLTDEQRESLEKMTEAIVNKLLQEPIDYLKSCGGSPVGSDIVSRVFNLEELDQA
jgi:glutamyl-tRNA reductase